MMSHLMTKPAFVCKNVDFTFLERIEEKTDKIFLSCRKVAALKSKVCQSAASIDFSITR